MMTHEEAITEAERLTVGIPWHYVRRVVSRDLERNWPSGEGLGSSDVSCHIACMVRCGDLESAVHPLTVIRDFAKANGRTFDEAFEDFRELLAPA